MTHDLSEPTSDLAGNIYRVYIVAYFMDFDNPGIHFQLSETIRVGNERCLFLKPVSFGPSSPELLAALLDAFRAGKQVQVETGSSKEAVRFGDLRGKSVNVKKLYLPFQ